MTNPPPATDYGAVIRANCRNAVMKELALVEVTISPGGAVQAAIGYVEGLTQWCEDIVGMSLAEMIELQKKG